MVSGGHRSARGLIPCGAISVALASTMALAAPPQFELAWSGNFAAPQGPTRFALEDIDGDGVLDGVFPGRNVDGRVVIMRGVGDGSFVPQGEVLAGSSTDWVEIVDVDGDGVRDLVLALRASNGHVAVARGLGGFDFEAPVLTQVGRDVRAVAVGEDDGTGHRPLFAMVYGESALRPLAPDGLGGHAVLARRPLTPWSGGPALPQWLGRTDVDGDGSGDLLAINTGSGTLTRVPQSGSALGSERSWRAPAIKGERPGMAIGAVADLGGNSAPDVATAGLYLFAPQSLVIFQNDGAGDFAQRFTFPAAIEGYAWAAAAGDFDLDGDVDAVLTTALPGAVVVLENDGAGGFTAVQEISAGTFVRHAWVADVDGDCLPDLISVDIALNRIIVHRNITPGLGGCGGVAEGDEQRATTRSKRAGPAIALPEPTGRGLAQTTALAARVMHATPAGAEAVTRVLADFGADDFVRTAPRVMTRGASDGGLAGDPASCGPPSGPCEEPHGGLGCFTTACCIEVCGLDPSCCDEGWDEICVEYADFSCVNIACPRPGSCFEPHLTRGCDDEVCCPIVTRLDGFCGGTFWDEICVLEAQRFCTVTPCTLPPPHPASIDEEEPCYKRFNQGCSGNTSVSANWIEVTCGSRVHGTSSTGAPRDGEWFRIELASETRLRFEVHAEFPARLLHLVGSCEGPLEVLADTSAVNCNTLALDACLPAGIHQFVLAPGIPERILTSGQPCDLIDPDAPPVPDPPPFVPGFFGLKWQVSIDCLGCGGVTGDIDGDGFVNGVDLALVLGSWGPCPGCPADLDGDGSVDGTDLAIVLGNWTG